MARLLRIEFDDALYRVTSGQTQETYIYYQYKSHPVS